MRRHIGFYVHHHGRGHTSRTRALVDALDLPVTVLTSAPHDSDTFGRAAVVELPVDDHAPETAATATLPAQLHYAPFGVAGLRERTARIARFLADAAPGLLVVDVSSEVSQLARIAGVPTVVVRQHGLRWDPAHMAAYDGAVGLLAPFGEELEEPTAPVSVRQKTFYAGGLARRMEQATRVDAGLVAAGVSRGGAGITSGGQRRRLQARERLGWDAETSGVVLLLGTGGEEPRPQDVVAAAKATPDHRWLVVGDWDHPDPAVASTGWVADALPWLDAGDVVVGSAGHNTVMEAATVGRPFVCIPQRRPFAEQHHKAARLRALDAAEVLDRWPSPSAWPTVLDRARRRGGGRLEGLADPGAAHRTAAWLTDLVDRFVG